MNIELTPELIGLAATNISALIGIYAKFTERMTKVETTQMFILKILKKEYGDS